MFRRALCQWTAIGCLLAPTVATAGSNSPSRDLTGLWTNQSQTSLTRPEDITQLEVSPEEAKKIVASRLTIGFTAEEKSKTTSDPNAGPPPAGDKDFGVKGYDPAWVAPGEALGTVNGHYRTSQIIDPVDGRLPFRDPAQAAKSAQAKRVAYETGNGPYNGPEQATLSERCLIGFGGTGGPGMLNTLYNNDYQFVQTKDHLAIDVEMAHDVRIIPIFASAQLARAKHQPDVIKPWLGDSVAWWEGDTLVAETINVPAAQGAYGPFPLSSSAKVTERFRRIGPKEILYRFTVDDPATYTKPWTAELTFHPTNAVFEYACHEGNYALEGMLSGARENEKALAAGPR
jgi:hypothetical protein